jgi:oligopeptide transport system substrate-binding protein
VPQLSVSYLGFQVAKAPFDDPMVRLAFAAATDRGRLAKVTFKGMREPAAGVLPPGIDGFDPTFAGVPFDPAQARRYLAESRYGSAAALPPITLTMSSGSGDFGESLAEMYARNLGVQMDVEEIQNGFFDGLNARTYQMFYVGWVADYPDPQDFLDVLLHGDSEVNHGGYTSPALDSLLERARIETDPSRRLALYRDAEKAAIEAAPIVPLFFDTDYVLVKPRVQGLRWTALGPLSLRDVVVTGN